MKIIKMHKIMKIVFLFCFNMFPFLGLCSKRSNENETCAASNIVATVAGYQNTIIHDSGNKVVTFSTHYGENNDRDADGILFYILYPTNLTGNIFLLSWTNQLDFFETDQKACERYKLGKLYVFKQSTPEIEDVIQNKLFFQLKKSPQALFVDVERYLWSTKEKIEYINELKARKLKKEKELTSIKQKLEEEKKRISRTKQATEDMPTSQTSMLRKYYELSNQTIPDEIKKITHEILTLQRFDLGTERE